MPAVWREIPPLELVERFLNAYALKGLTDTKWFTKRSCSLGEVEALLPEVQPYYMPCKATDLGGDLTFQVAFRVLRHMVKAHGINLLYVEKSCRGKELWYHLSSSEANTEVRFD